MTWNDYFELKWLSALNGDTTVTRRYRMLLQDAQHANRGNLNGYSQNLKGYLMVVRVAFRPHQVLGIVRIDEDETITQPDGTRAELEEAARSAVLECKMFDDSAFWKAEWVGGWTPGHYDPGGNYWYFPMELRQKEP